MQETSLGLKKPELNEFYDLLLNNANLDLLDQLIAARIEKIMIANNLLTTEEGLVLDARQGKALNDKYNELNNNLANKILLTLGLITTNLDLNNVGNEVLHAWRPDYSDLVNAPADITSYNGYALLLESVVAGDRQKQTLTISNSIGGLTKIYVRCRNGSNWGPWKSITFS